MLNRLRASALVVPVAVLGLVISAPASAQRLPVPVSSVTSVEGIDEYKLPNGLQLLLIPDDSKPTTTVNLTYRVGSRHENYGETGMAHLLEHMLFKGTPKHVNIFSEFSKRGLAANGSTSYDRTNYTASFSRNDDNLQWYIDWLADAMVNSFIARKDLDSEMTVVRNEMESGENSPDRVLLQKTMAVMYDWHNYGKSTIGARTDVENVDIPRLQAFYRLYYQPDNATLIVSGSFDPAKVRQWVAASFGKIAKPARKLPTQYTLEPVQDGERSVTLRRVGGAPVLIAGYHVPAGPSSDDAAVELLSIVFGDVPSGRLHKRLTEAQLASGAFAFPYGLAEPSTLIFGAQLAPGQDVDQARSELLATLESNAREPVTAEELERAKAKWLKDWEQSFANPEAIGLALSTPIAQGDWRLFFLARDRVREATLADLQRVATQYLLPTNRTLGIYLPTDAPQRAPALAKVDIAQLMKGFKPNVAAAKVESFEATPANIDARTQRFSVGAIQAAVLPKGTRGGAVEAILVLHFGDEKSLFGQGELPDVTASLIDKGTKTLNRLQVQDRLDQLKTELAVSSSIGRVTISLNSRREFLAAAIELVGDLLRNPVFPADAVDELKRQALTAIEQQRKEPEALADNALDRLSDPYPVGDVRHARSFDEIAADVNALDAAKLRAFHASFYGAGKGEFSAVGDLDVEGVQRALQAAFGGWQAGAPFTRVPTPLIAIKPERLLIAVSDKQNAVMQVRQDIPLTDSHADYPALSVANYLLGGGGSSRLWKRLREVEGLSYDVRSGINWNTNEPNSDWQASAIYAPQNRAKVEAAFKEEVARALREGFTAQELAEGQRGLLAFRRLGRAQDGAIAAGLVNNLYLGRTFARSSEVDAAIAKLSIGEVNAALRKYLKPQDFASVFAGDFPTPP